MTPKLNYYPADFGTHHREFYFSHPEVNSYCVDGHYYYPPHQHGEYFDWIYIIQGQRHETINGENYVFQPGDMFWIRKGDWHEGMGDQLRYFKLSGKTAWLEGLINYTQTMEAYQSLLKLSAPPCCRIPPAKRKAFTEEWERCYRMQMSRMGLVHAVHWVTHVLVNYFFPQIEQSMRYHLFPDWLHKGTQYIQEHFKEDISSEQLADICEKSPEHVARSFQAYLGQTPSQYINHLRLNYAANLLTTTQLSILDVCLRAGFGSLGYFNRLFKRRFHRPPRIFRSEYQKLREKQS